MTRQRTFTALLAVAVALLGLDLVLRLSPQEAVAQDEPQVWPPPPVPEPTVVSVSVSSAGDFRGYRMFRLWSDGQVDVTVVAFGISEPCTFRSPCGPVVVIPGP